jgi:TPR repeat protein
VLRAAFAHFAIGIYLFDAGLAALRDPKRALNHFRLARGCYPAAMRSLARAFETGVGTDRDPVKAVGYLGLMRANGSQAEADYTRLMKTLSLAEQDRLKSFRVADDSAAAAFENEYRPTSNPNADRQDIGCGATR